MPRGKPRKPRQAKPPEQKFAVHLTVDDSKVGEVLRCFANIKGVEINGVLPITQHDTQRNLPRGELRRAIVEIIEKANTKQVGVDNLKEALQQMGFTKAIHSQIPKAIREGHLKKNKNHTISLGSWKQ